MAQSGGRRGFRREAISQVQQSHVGVVRSLRRVDHCRIRPRSPVWVAAIALAMARCCPAPPPMVTGDVPTPDKGTFESYIGALYNKNGGIERDLPFAELVYGIADRWEVSGELPLVSADGHYGARDLALGTKYVLLPETDERPGMAVRYETKFDTGDAERGLGSGGYEHLLRFHAQKTFGWFTPIVNIGGILVPDVEVHGEREARRDVWLANFEQQWRVTPRMKLLSEINWKTSDTPGEPYRLAWNVGFRHRVHDGLFVHGAGGSSLRAHQEGGPELRLYFGLEYDFDLRHKE